MMDNNENSTPFYARLSESLSASIFLQNEIALYTMRNEAQSANISQLQAIPIGENQGFRLKKADYTIVTLIGLSFSQHTYNRKKEEIPSVEGCRHSSTALESQKQSIGPVIEVQQAIEEGLYKTVDSKEEFGISRFVADRVYHMPRLLKNMVLKGQQGTNTYILQSEHIDPSGNNIKLEHRLLASCREEAIKIAEIIVKRLHGVQNKIWMAAWRLANQLARFTYTCELTKLMKLCYPERDAYFISFVNEEAA